MELLLEQTYRFQMEATIDTQPVITGGIQVIQPEQENKGPVFLSTIRELQCSGKNHHRIGVECLVRWHGRTYRMLHEDGTAENQFKMGVSTAFCGCGARWDYHSGGLVSRKNQLFE